MAFACAGETAPAESLAQDLGKRYPLDTQMQSLWLPSIRAQLLLDGKNPAAALKALPAPAAIELWANPVPQQYFLSLSGLCTRRGIPGGRAGRRCRRRISEDSRPPWHCLELLDGSIGALGSGSGQRPAGRILTGCRGRCCPCPGARCLQGIPHPLERRRSRHPHSERSQGGVREAAVMFAPAASVAA